MDGRVRRYTVPDTLPWALPGGFLTIGWRQNGEKWQVSLRTSLMKRQLRSQLLFQDGYFEEQDDTWRFTPTYLPGKPNPIYWDVQGGGASLYANYQLTSHHALSLEGLITNTTSQRLSLEQAAYINPNNLFIIPPSFCRSRRCLCYAPPGSLRVSRHRKAHCKQV
ncbi:MAG: hypothetical protein NZ580_06120 [Bacteroidia bacterium]|nr:hypothetical protein [Bacteroidia bacterium]MDW8236386.1 hypothetical protein [Bacteroidia bacterium]